MNRARVLEATNRFLFGGIFLGVSEWARLSFGNAFSSSNELVAAQFTACRFKALVTVELSTIRAAVFSSRACSCRFLQPASAVLWRTALVKRTSLDTPSALGVVKATMAFVHLATIFALIHLLIGSVRVAALGLCLALVVVKRVPRASLAPRARTTFKTLVAIEIRASGVR